MTAMLTTKQLQERINVDRSTIYRMAEDGRLPAVKVGRQWRFPAESVELLLGQNNGIEPTPTDDLSAPIGLHSVLPTESAQAIADLAADLFGVMAVVTDMGGKALTTVANPCGYFTAVYNNVYTADRCSDGWRRLGEEIDLEPHFLRSHLGFLCARSFIRTGSALAGMVIVGGVAPDMFVLVVEEHRGHVEKLMPRDADVAGSGEPDDHQYDTKLAKQPP